MLLRGAVLCSSLALIRILLSLQTSQAWRFLHLRGLRGHLELPATQQSWLLAPFNVEREGERPVE